MEGPISLLKQSIAYYREHVRVFTSVLAVPFILTFFVSLINPREMTAVFVVGSFVANLVSVFSAIALTDVFVQKGNPEGGVLESYKKSLKLFFPVIWIGILTALAVFGGFAVLIIPGFYLAVLFGLTMFVLVGENKRGLAALTQSAFYIKNNWWAVFGRFFVFWLIIMIPSFLIGIGLGAAGLTTPGMETSVPFAPSNVEPSFLGALILNFWQTFIVAPLGVIFGGLIYNAFRAAKPIAPPEEETKIRKMIRIFTIIGIVAIALLILYAGVMIAGYSAADSSQGPVSSPVTVV